MNSNPYTWGYIDNHEVTTRVPTLSFKYPDGSDLPVTGLATSIELIMFDNDNNNYTITNSSLIQSPHYDPLASTSFETWTLEGGKSKKLLIDAETGTSSISALHVMVRVEAVPNATDLVNGVTPTATIKAYLGAGYEASSDQYTDYKEITTANMATGVDHRLYTFYVSPEWVPFVPLCCNIICKLSQEHCAVRNNQRNHHSCEKFFVGENSLHDHFRFRKLFAYMTIME